MQYRGREKPAHGGARRVAAIVHGASRYARRMSLLPFVIALYVVAVLLALGALAQAGAMRTRWRGRRRFAAGHRLLWALLFFLAALLAALMATALLGYRRLAAETPIARLDAVPLAPQRWSLAVETPDGERRTFEIAGDQWQLDARVIKWTPGAVVAGAPTLYQLDRLSGRYADVAQEREGVRSAYALSSPQPFDLWHLKRQFPRWLPWVDADFGSSAYLPLVAGGHYDVTLAAAGGLVARPADEQTKARIEQTGF